MRGNPAGLVYGTIAVGALLAAESARRETYAKTVSSVAITLLIYWLAHSYAEYTGDRLDKSEPFRLGDFGRKGIEELSVLAGSAIPLLVLFIAWATGAGLGTAITEAIWTSAAMIVIIELVVGFRAELTGRELVMQTAFGALLGLLVILLRVILH
jgi:hypothetical protein